MSKRYFLIDTGRYGGELCIGTVPADFVDYWNPKVGSEGDTDLIANLPCLRWLIPGVFLSLRQVCVMVFDI